MLRRVLILVLAACALLPTAAGAARRPAAAQTLWATVNQCDTLARPGAVGVRVAIPAGVGAPEQWARIHLQWFDAKARAWRALRGPGGAWTRLGIGLRSVEGGSTFTFKAPPAGARLVLRGIVDVEWRNGAKIVDRARLHTTAGHEDPVDPRLTVSQTSCEIAR
jgi:hypothetical protein